MSRIAGRDPPALYADSSKAVRELGWEIQYTNVQDIIATAWKWHKDHPEGFQAQSTFSCQRRRLLVALCTEMATSGSVTKAFAPERTRKQSSERDADWLIVQEVQEGRVGAFDQLVSKYRESIFSIIYNLTGNREDASDLTQITFIKAFQAIGRFRGRSAFFTWLYRIALNTTMSFLKKHSKRRFINYETVDESASSSEIVEKLTAKSRTEKVFWYGNCRKD